MSSPDRFRRAEELFHRALELPADSREAFIATECGEDADLAAEVLRLLARDSARTARALRTPIGAVTGEEAAPAPEAVAGQRIGRYTLVRRIGEGGMGVVYEARQSAPRRTVALKVLRGVGRLGAEQERTFRREVETLARLKHPGVAAIHESGRTGDGRPFFAMELVEGETLREHCRRRPALSREELAHRLGLFREIAAVVQYAHQHGVIHRDLKPSNIVVPADGGIKILDFGLARITDADVAASTRTDIGVVKGTLAYMSPEQARGNPLEIDSRSDVYALGVVLYEMLTGALPLALEDASLVEALRRIEEHTTRPLRQSWSGPARLDRDLETIVGKALDQDPDSRYSSAAALSDDVDRYLTSRPILARPPSAVYQLRKFARRNRVLVGGTAATALALIAGSAVATAFGLHSMTQRRAAERARDDLEQVVGFQAEMLAGIDPGEMGRGLVDDLRARVATGWRDRGVPDERIDAALAQLDESMEVINPTDAALRIVDRDILDRATRQIEESFGDRPAVAARLHHSIGNTYRELGLFGPAEEQALRAVELGREEHGEDHEATLRYRNGLATVYWRQARFDEAEPIYRDVLARQRILLGQQHEDTLRSMNNLANLLWRTGRYDQAEPLHRETLEGKLRVLGPDHPSTLNTRNNLALLLDHRGRFEEAEVLYVEVLADQRRVLGDAHRQTMRTMHNLGTLYLKQRRLEEAEATLSSLLAVRRRVLGDEHRATLATQGNLAAAYLALDRLDEAEPLLVTVLEIRTKHHGREHPETIQASNNLARLHRRRGRLDEAERLLRDNLELRRRRLGDEHPETLQMRHDLAGIHWEQGRDAQAEVMARASLEASRRVLGIDHPDTLGALKDLAGRYRERGRPDEAERMLREAWEALSEGLGVEHARTREVAAELAELHEARGRPDQAAPWRVRAETAASPRR